MNTPSPESVRYPGSDYLLSLSKLAGHPIKDVTGYVTREFGQATFKIVTIVFEDGKEVWVEGEHDMPYLCGEIPGVAEGTLEALYEASNS